MIIRIGMDGGRGGLVRLGIDYGIKEVKKDKKDQKQFLETLAGYREFQVESDSDMKNWIVKMKDGKLSCNCPSWIFNRRGNRTCKHTDKVELMLSQTGKM